MLDFILAWLGDSSGPMVFYCVATLGMIISERSGVYLLGAEGFMLVGALFGAAMALTVENNTVLALATAAFAGSLVGLLYAGLVVLLRVNQIIASLALVFFCQGLTSLIGQVGNFGNRAIANNGLIDLGPLGGIAVGDTAMQAVMLVVTAMLFAGVLRVLWHTTTGLRLRAIGENPDAADAAGLGISRYRFLAVVAGAATVALAGGLLSVVNNKIWISGMTAGRGWIVVALVIFARWHPWRALAGAVLFGGIETFVPQVAAAGVDIPQYLVMALPYAVTLLVMAATGLGAFRSSGEPAALGRPYVREERH
ncbi:MAG: ABC transporter permease [Parvibaculaceae bacterium]